MPTLVGQVGQKFLFPALNDDAESSTDNSKPVFRCPSFAANKQSPIHRWVPWIAGFSSEFVKDALQRYLKRKTGVVLDPFAGVGTTLVEAVLSGHHAIGFEINPYAVLACSTKLDSFQVDPELLVKTIEEFEEYYADKSVGSHRVNSAYPVGFRTRGEFYSPKVLRKVLVVKDFFETLEPGVVRNLFRVAFASTMISYSNYSYEPSLGQRKSAGKSNVEDHPVGDSIAGKLYEMAEDINLYRKHTLVMNTESQVWQESFFNCRNRVQACSVDLLITSPPYLNNYHYNRNTRPQLYWLGLVDRPEDMRTLEENNFGKFWQTVRGEPSIDLQFELEDSDLREKIEILRGLNSHKGVYGGNGWANYAAAYFNDCHRFAKLVKCILKRRGTALIVIGNNILQGITFETDRYLGQIMSSIGLELGDIYIPRSSRIGNSIIRSNVRVGKAEKSQKLYEAIVEVRKK